MMPVKSGPLFIVCCFVWSVDAKIFAVGESQQHSFAEVKRSLNNFEREIVQPVEVNENGQPLGEHGIRTRRDTTHNRRYFILEGFRERLHLEVQPEPDLLAPSFKVYHLGGSLGHQEDKRELEKCLFRGQVKNRPNSAVALNLCGGMRGMVKTEDSDYLLEPVNHHSEDTLASERPHILSKRSLTKELEKEGTKDKTQRFFCGKKRRYMPHRPKRRDYWLPGEFASGRTQNTSLKKRTKRWTSGSKSGPLREGGNKRHPHYGKKRRNVETLVVADREMVQKHGTENVTTYLLTVFNMVAMLYQDSAIGSNVSVILVGLVLLEGDEPGLSLSHNAENSLNSFCQWQSTIHTSKGHQHDHAVLITGLDICSWKNEPCDTLGYAPISGMCSKYRSCTINEDSGLALAFTVAHEIGHNFGMIHDGQGSSPCRRKRGTLMSASLSGLDTSLLWSDCSKRDLAKFLEYGLPPTTPAILSPRSTCLKNEPDSPDELQFPNHLPGQLYGADMQCRLQFGTKSRLCEHYPRQGELCRSLWCQRNGRECETKFLPAAEGTPCGKRKWCRKGGCVDLEVENLRVVDGGWGTFNPWSSCTASCGGGLMVRERFCDSPPPANGGSYCKGEEKEYQICNAQNCLSSEGVFQNDLCSTFNKRTVKGKLYKWNPYGKDLGALSRCRIYCVPDKDDLYLVLSTKLPDGTSCSGNYSSVCVDGECRAVGCDGKVDSAVIPDQCGVCNGDNSTCKTIKGYFDTSNLSVGYHEVIRIPTHSRHISIYESDERSTFLALKSKTGNYKLNGNWTLDWPGRYSIVGALFSYRRWPGKPESLYTKGPIIEDLIIEVLVKELADITIHYEFVVSLNEHHWALRNSSCSVTCGEGIFLLKPVCENAKGESVHEIYCAESTKPENKSYSCNGASCETVWSAGEWLLCSSNPCDPGIQTRPVFCTERGVKVSNSKCDADNRPMEMKECGKDKCPFSWYAGPWSKCRGKCSNGFQTRSITCRREANGTAESFSQCKDEQQPPYMRKCKMSDCVRLLVKPELTWVAGVWSECKGDCVNGRQSRVVSCVNTLDGSVQNSGGCSVHSKPEAIQNCSLQKCTPREPSECEDQYQWCSTSVNQRLCQLKFYATNCCTSCRKR